MHRLAVVVSYTLKPLGQLDTEFIQSVPRQLFCLHMCVNLVCVDFGVNFGVNEDLLGSAGVDCVKKTSKGPLLLIKKTMRTHCSFDTLKNTRLPRHSLLWHGTKVSLFTPYCFEFEKIYTF
jgi:hypothetical protein